MFRVGSRCLKNLVFANLPVEVQWNLLHAGEELDLPVGMDLYQAGCRLNHVYFLTAGMASILVEMKEGESAEAGMIGDEGMVGIVALLGSPIMKRHCLMQIAGAGLSVPLSVMQGYFQRGAHVRHVVLTSFSSQLFVAEQVTACNRPHAVNRRLARWILTAADRVLSEQVLLTQEVLGQMLGSMRTTVALVAGEMQRAKAIEYTRGKVRILDRTALIRMACDCYPLIRDSRLVDPADYELNAA